MEINLHGNSCKSNEVTAFYNQNEDEQEKRYFCPSFYIIVHVYCSEAGVHNQQ